LASLSRLARTASFRLAAIYAALLLASSLILFLIVYLIAAQALLDGLRSGIEAQSRLLADQYHAEGREPLAKSHRQRILAGASRSTFFLLRDPAGHRIAGNIDATGAPAGWTTLDAPRLQGDDDPDAAEERQIIAFGRRLGDGTYLLVGEDSHRVVEAKEAMLRAFAWATVALVLLAIAGGVAVSARFLRRIDAINKTTREIIEGRLSRRIPLHGTDDELDRLGGNLNEMLDRIEGLMASLQQVSSDIAHDLRTPLSRLRQTLERARDESATAPHLAAPLEKAIGEADAILATFGALLRIAQVESGSRRAAFADTDLSALVESVVETYAPVAEDERKQIVARIAPGIRFRGDRDLLLQMVVNVVENAIRHAPPGTVVEIELAAGANGPVVVVADRGAGIPPAERDKVFRRFHRLEASRTTPGSGLGLALVAAVAELHHIRVELGDNAPGLRVQFAFPSPPVPRHRSRTD
jgi:signal transduction histidine kinase